MTPADLEALFVALRGAGLLIGVTETMRLRTILALAPDVGPAGLEKLVALVLVRSADDADTVRRVFRAWFQEGVERLGRETEAAGEGTSSPGGEGGDGQRGIGEGRSVGEGPGAGEERSAGGEEPRGSAGREGGRGAPDDKNTNSIGLRWKALLAAGGVLLLGGVAAISWGLSGAGSVEAVANGSAGTAEQGAAVVAGVAPSSPSPSPSLPSPSLSSPSPSSPLPVPLPSPSVSAEPPAPPVDLAALARWVVACLAALLGIGLWTALSRRWSLPEPVRVPPGAVPVESPPPPMLLASPILLDASARDDLVAGVGRYETDRPSRLLDAARTVTATAAGGGVPSLVYLREGEHRAVWLWIDESSDRPLLERVADETTRALASAGLRAEVACYNAVPDRLFLPDGTPLSAADIESRKSDHVVAVLTDGRDLGLLSSSPLHRLRVQAVMRALSRWPRLAIVDFGEGRHDTPRLGAAHGVPVVSPEAMTTFLADGAVDRPAAPGAMPLVGEARAWAAACALAPHPVDTGTAYLLRDALGLRVSPWAMRALLATSADTSDQITFSRADRAALRTWSWTSEGSAGVSGSGEAGISGDGLLARSLRFWRGRYHDDPAKRRSTPLESIRTMTPAERGRLADMALLDLWDAPDDTAPWLHALSATEVGERIRAELARHAPRPERSSAVGQTGDVEMAVLPWRWTERGELRVRTMLTELGLGAVEPRPREILRRPGGFAVAIGLLAGLSFGAVSAVVGSDRSGQDDSAKEREAERPEVSRPDADPEGDSGVEAGPDADGGTEPDAGEGDVASAAEDAPESEVGAPDAGLAKGLIIDGKECKLNETEHQGIRLVWVCGGTFTMGSAGDDSAALADEKPAHKVTISGFWMGKYEVSNTEYRKSEPDHRTSERADWPATSVSWNEAKAFCARRGLRLPTEAEWEYAARGPEGRKYPWGAGTPTEKLARFGRSLAEGALTAGSFEGVPSPFGTKNQAGNASEWVEDCYSSTTYQRRASSHAQNPLVDTPAGCSRVLRGGAFSSSASLVRSAARRSSSPEARSWVAGFRCARSDTLVPANPIRPRY